jgi:hypothetical protein
MLRWPQGHCACVAFVGRTPIVPGAGQDFEQVYRLLLCSAASPPCPPSGYQNVKAGRYDTRPTRQDATARRNIRQVAEHAFDGHGD